MSAPLWAVELADAFWAAAGEPGPFPRDLAGPVARGWPLTVVDIAGLSLATARAWLAERGVPCPAMGPDRRLRAGLVATGGDGVVFLDADDPSDERRFSLAHEVAHHLRDAWRVRERAAARLGRDVLAVVDGKRPATAAERLHAALAGLPLALDVHLLRREAGEPPPGVAAVERDADRLAYELLAPAEVARGRSVNELMAAFGLPRTQAMRYRAILHPVARPDPLLARLKDASAKRR
ncbi:MAG: hypothetical protein U0746_08330 [Gemmataceae bacterium]